MLAKTISITSEPSFNKQGCGKLVPFLICTILFWILMISYNTAFAASERFVTDHGDSGPGSLRDEIASAASGDSIIPSADDTTNLSSQIAINSNITIGSINFPNYKVTSNGNSGIFDIRAGLEVTFDSITISGALNNSPGGGINVWNNTIINLNSGVKILDNLSGPTAGIGGNGGGINMDRGGALYIKDNVVISGNRANNYLGGGINMNDGIIDIADYFELSNNYANYSGGGIYIEKGSLTIAKHANISHNKTLLANLGGDGGGIYSAFANVIIGDEAIFDSNISWASGGGIYVREGDFSLGNSVQVINNQALTNNGGGLFTYIGALTIGDNILVENNYAKGSGGGIYSKDGDITLGIQAIFQDNSTDGDGGGLYSDAGDVLIGNGATFINNNSASSGGGVYNHHDTLEFGNNLILRGNIASFNGGGAASLEDTLIVGENALIENNQASFGGGLFSGNASNFPALLQIGKSARFLNNQASSHGGALMAYGDLSIDQNAYFYDNKALNGHGGAISVNSNSSIIGNTNIGANAIFNKNTATGTEITTGLGGAIYATGNMSLNGGTFTNNQASTNLNIDASGGLGGAIYHTASGGDYTLDFNASSTSPFYFSGNTHKPNNTGLQANSIYLANNASSGNTSNTTLNLNTAAGSVIEFYDPLSSQADNLIGSDGNQNKSYGKLIVNLNKTGEGLLRLAGHNYMPSEAHWDIQAGALHLIPSDHFGGLGYKPTLIDLSHNNSSFTLRSGSNLNLTPVFAPLGSSNPTPHLIKANDISLLTGSRVGIVDFTYGPTLSSNIEYIVLDLDANNLTNDSDIALTEGIIHVGHMSYHYDNLRWIDSGSRLVFNLNKARVNSQVVPSTVGGHGAGAIYSPVPKFVFNRINWRYNEREAGMSGLGQISNDPGNNSVWVANTNSYTRHEGSALGQAFKLKTYNGIIGYDKWLDSDILLGTALAYEQQNYDYNRADLKGSNIYGLIYGSTILPYNLELSALLAYSRINYDQDRNVYGEKLTAEYDGSTFIAGQKISRLFELNEQFSLRPALQYKYINLKIDDYKEREASQYALNVDKYQQNFHLVEAGVEALWQSSEKIFIGGELSYYGVFGDRSSEVTSFFINDPQTNKFTSTGTNADRDNIALRLKTGFALSDNISIQVDGTAIYGKSTQSYQGGLGLDFSW